VLDRFFCKSPVFRVKVPPGLTSPAVIHGPTTVPAGSSTDRALLRALVEFCESHAYIAYTQLLLSTSAAISALYCRIWHCRVSLQVEQINHVFYWRIWSGLSTVQRTHRLTTAKMTRIVAAKKLT